MMIISKRTIATALALAFAAAACSGPSGVTPPAAGSSGSSGSHGDAVFVVKIPHPVVAAGSKHPAYLTPQVRGIDFSVYANDGTAPNNRGYAFFALSPQATYCTDGTSALTCTLSVQAYPGDDWFGVTTYDQANPTTPYNGGSSHVISTGGAEAIVAADGTNTVSITTSGVVSKVLIGLDDPFPAAGTPYSQNVHVVGLDADNNVIVGNYDSPLSLSDSDTSGVTSLSTTSVANSGVLPQLNYTGGSIPTGASITATTTSPDDPYNRGPFHANAIFLPGSLSYYGTPAYFTFGSVHDAAQTLTINGTSATYASTSGCVGIVTLGGSGPYTVTPVAAGSCNMVLSYSGGNTVTIPVVVGPN